MMLFAVIVVEIECVVELEFVEEKWSTCRGRFDARLRETRQLFRDFFQPIQAKPVIPFFHM